MTLKLKPLVYLLVFLSILFSGIFAFADLDALLLKREKFLENFKSRKISFPVSENKENQSQTTIDSVLFSPPVNYSTERYPVSVFFADLDGDKDLDLIAATWPHDSPENISVLKNNGDGTFGSAVDYPSGNLPYSVFVADLDGDSDLDLATANVWSDDVSILKNNGDGTFQEPVNYRAGEGPFSVFCADLDRDLDLDLAVGNLYSNDVSVLLNRGDGTFHQAKNYEVNDLPSAVFCADLDHDFDLDIAVSSFNDDDVCILINSGDGTFQKNGAYPTGIGPRALFCADLDGDLDLDLATANMLSHNVSVLLNSGDGTFQSRSDYGVGHDPYSVFGADLNGDQDLDLAVANWTSSSVSILLNLGDGNFQKAVNYPGGDHPHFIFCADLDGDLDLDLATANEHGGNVSIMKNLSQVPANQPPYPFSLFSPEDGDTLSAIVTLGFEAAYDPNFGDQVTYDLHLSTSPDFPEELTTVHSDLTKSQYTDTLGENTYFWKVKAKDNWGGESWSVQTQCFNVVYIQGDANGDADVNLSDVGCLFHYIFKGEAMPCPSEIGDVNCDNLINLADIIHIALYVLQGKPFPC